MFRYLDTSGAVAPRLAPSDRTGFVERFRTGLHVAYGIVQREDVTVPPEPLEDTERMLPYGRASHGDALTLRPKATGRR